MSRTNSDIVDAGVFRTLEPAGPSGGTQGGLPISKMADRIASLSDGRAILLDSDAAIATFLDEIDVEVDAEMAARIPGMDEALPPLFKVELKS